MEKKILARQYYQNHKEQAKQYYQDHKEQILAKRKQHYQDHKKQAKQYCQEHKEQTSERNKQYHQKHKKRLSTQKKQYYQKHKKRLKQYRQEHKAEIAVRNKRYRQTEAGRVARRNDDHIRRAREMNASIIEKFDPKEIFERDGWICQLCGCKTRPDYKNTNHSLYPNLDHIIPLSKNGAHSRFNTQCSCHQCNMEKSNKIIGQLRMFG